MSARSLEKQDTNALAQNPAEKLEVDLIIS